MFNDQLLFLHLYGNQTSFIGKIQSCEKVELIGNHIGELQW
jgi:hypothetical protein